MQWHGLVEPSKIIDALVSVVFMVGLSGQSPGADVLQRVPVLDIENPGTLAVILYQKVHSYVLAVVVLIHSMRDSRR